MVVQVGANPAPSNVNNITAVLFLWTILPGYAAASYMPTIVLERPLFVRSAPTLWLAHSPSHKPCCRMDILTVCGSCWIYRLCTCQLCTLSSFGRGIWSAGQGVSDDT